MNKALGILGIVVLAVVLVAVLIGAGIFLGRLGWTNARLAALQQPAIAAQPPAAQGFPGMMGRGGIDGWADGQPGPQDLQRPGRGTGMMGGPGGMMGDRGFAQLGAAEPLTVDETRQAVEAFLGNLNNADLKVGEIMVFQNNSYAAIVDSKTGQGALEVLVNPATRAVHLEFGPAMMWNTQYGMMAGSAGLMGRQMGAMMGGPAANAEPQTTPAATPTVTAEKAIELAQTYIDGAFPGDKASQDVLSFPGYFTIDILKDGQPTGMLSVNAYTGQVWYHSWHGAFVAASE